jgi:hypothetical protein
MHAKRMLECLKVIRWSPSTLAQSLGIEASKVELWIRGREEIPIRIGSWLEALCFTHEASDLMRPSLATGAGPTGPAVRGPHREHVPAYSYGLLRQLNQGPVPLRQLFGTDDEAAVFFLVSRGLAERNRDELVITTDGRKLGEVTALAPSVIT